MPSEYDKTARERLIYDIVQSELQQGLAVATIIPSPPKPTALHDRNTEVTLNVYRGSQHVNCLVSFLNREFLDDVLGPLNAAELDISTASTTYDVLPLINANYGVNLAEEDILLENLSANGNIIQASPDSYGWLGSFSFTSTVLIFPPLLRTTNNRLLITRGGIYLRRLFPTYP